MFSAASVYVLHRGFVPRPHTNHKTSLKRGFAIASINFISLKFVLSLSVVIRRNDDKAAESGRSQG